MGRGRKNSGNSDLNVHVQDQSSLERRSRRNREQGRTQVSYRDTVQKRNSKKKKRHGGTIILILLILLAIACIGFFVKDTLKEKLDDTLAFLGLNTEKVIEEAEQLAVGYDYDGALAVLKESKRFDSDEELQAKAAEYETARSAMSEEINSVISEAQNKIGQLDYQAAIDTIKNSRYYNSSVLLKGRADEYQKALDDGSAADKTLVEQADRLALSYDYDGAAELLKNAVGYEASPILQQKVSEYETKKAACVAVNPEEVTHIFYHSLVVDPSKAFVEGSEGYDGWQQWMTTLYEFDKITQSMYDRGYVLVALDDLYSKETAADGTVTISPKQVFLPEGKKAFVLSLDDLSYYHTYDNHGVASKVVLDEEGKPTCEYIQDDGTVVYGDYDAVPRLDTFLEEHPDGCYKGARGTIALTGYDGILGYRTDGAYDENHNTDSDTYYADELQLQWLEKHPDYDWNKECADAKAVADAMKAEGWTFANHTWGHKAVGEASYEKLVQDTERWLSYVEPLVGETDKMIFAHGQDIAQVSEYTSSDKFQYLKSKGFYVYCPVDSAAYSTDVTSDFFHQGRRNLDGYRIYQDCVSENPMASDLFDANEVLDPDRPLPVPELN